LNNYQLTIRNYLLTIAVILSTGQVLLMEADVLAEYRSVSKETPAFRAAAINQFAPRRGGSGAFPCEKEFSVL
jgi:hypothetical protein